MSKKKTKIVIRPLYRSPKMIAAEKLNMQFVAGMLKAGEDGPKTFLEVYKYLVNDLWDILDRSN